MVCKKPFSVSSQSSYCMPTDTLSLHFPDNIKHSFHFSIAGALMYLNEATLLNNIRIRYMKDCIYVSEALTFR